MNAPHSPSQTDLFGAPAPEGFGYWPEVLSPEEEATLVAQIAELPFKPFEFHQYLGNRRIVSFGRRYDYGRRSLDEAEEPPAFIADVRERVAALAHRPADDFAQIMVSEYAPGAGIGWHRDKPEFGVIVGVSLLAACAMRFRRKAGERWERMSAPLEPRSAYMLDGPARTDWQHSIVPMQALRYSITFRTLAGSP